MTPMTSSVKFDQALWNVRSAGYCADTENPYIYSSTNWAVWEAGRAFGLGRVSQARGLYLNVQTDHGNYRISFDELAAAPSKVMKITYAFGVSMKGVR